MKSLDERLKFRAKQKAQEQKDRETSPTAQGRENDKVGSEGEDTFDAAEWVNDDAKNINDNLTELSDDELSQVEEAEAKGKKRASVLNAIKKEKDGRAEKGAGWSANKA